MPLMAKCLNCGFIVWANTKGFLKMLMREHDSHSHRTFDSEDYGFCNWIITVLSFEAYSNICMASKSPSFWKAIRSPRLKP